jgi:hypothetical protein
MGRFIQAVQSRASYGRFCCCLLFRRQALYSDTGAFWRGSFARGTGGFFLAAPGDNMITRRVHAVIGRPLLARPPCGGAAVGTRLRVCACCRSLAKLWSVHFRGAPFPLGLVELSLLVVSPSFPWTFPGPKSSYNLGCLYFLISLFVSPFLHARASTFIPVRRCRGCRLSELKFAGEY